MPHGAPVDSGPMKTSNISLLKTSLSALIPQTILESSDYISGKSSNGKVTKPFVAIVDDEVVIRNVFSLALKMMGYEVLGTYCDGKDIVDKIDSLAVKPEVIIMDERMPRMNGLVACAIIVEKYPGIKIIFVTGDTLAPATVDFLEPNHLPYVAKPFLVEEIKSAVNQKLESNNKSMPKVLSRL